MLSILIPVYNVKVEKLVRTLLNRCSKAGIDFEILCFDDASRDSIRSENAILSNYFGVNYTELSENLGRARIRNWMARSAGFENLLFLDCDSRPVGRSFIRRYVDCIESGYDIVSGGRVYRKKKPRAKSKYLHWLYGKKKESRPAKHRNRYPTELFHSNNFLVRRDLMLDVPFDESLDQYGYEDLLWARQAHQKNYRITHIDNPVEHLGLEPVDKFLKKTRLACENLARIKKENDSIDTRLTRFADKLDRWKLTDYFMNFMGNRLVNVEKKLKAPGASLFLYQLYKLYHYMKLR